MPGGGEVSSEYCCTEYQEADDCYLLIPYDENGGYECKTLPIIRLSCEEVKTIKGYNECGEEPGIPTTVWCVRDLGNCRFLIDEVLRGECSSGNYYWNQEDAAREKDRRSADCQADSPGCCLVYLIEQCHFAVDKRFNSNQCTGTNVKWYPGWDGCLSQANAEGEEMISRYCEGPYDIAAPCMWNEYDVDAVAEAECEMRHEGFETYVADYKVASLTECPVDEEGEMGCGEDTCTDGKGGVMFYCYKLPQGY